MDLKSGEMVLKSDTTEITSGKKDMHLETIDLEFGTIKVTATSKNKTLARESNGCAIVVICSVVFIAFDVWKQVCSYGMKYYNNGKYLMPQTAIVTLTELLKCSIFLVILAWQGKVFNIRVSCWYAVPSIIYAINNNAYFLALHYVTPPIYNIFGQMRMLFMALTYRFVFKKDISVTRWFALVVLVVALTCTTLMETDVFGGHGSTDVFIALALSVVTSALSVVGTVTVEVREQFAFVENGRYRDRTREWSGGLGRAKQSLEACQKYHLLANKIIPCSVG